MKYFTILAATAALGLAGAAQAQVLPQGGGVGVGGTGGVGIGNGGMGGGGAAGGTITLPDTATTTDPVGPSVEETWERTDDTVDRGIDNARTRVEQAEAEGQRGLDRAEEVQDTEVDGDVRVDTPAGAANANVHAGTHPAGEVPADEGDTSED